MWLSTRIFLVAVVLAVTLASEVVAKEMSPEERAVSLFAEAKKLVSLEPARQKESLASLFDDYFYFGEFSRLTMGDHWVTLTDVQKEEFRNAFRERMIDSLYDRVKKKRKSTLGFKIDSVRKGDGYVEVKGDAVVGDKAVNLSLFWMKDKDKWKIVDLTAAKANLIANYKGQFDKMMDEHGFEYLMEKIEKKDFEQN